MADVGISIEGLGTSTSTSGDGPGGTIWGWSGDPISGTGYEWTDGLVEPPTTGKDEADPATCELSVAGFSASLHMRPSLRRVLLARQDLPVYELQSAIDSSGTTIDTGEGIIPSVIYVGSETMRVTNNYGDGTQGVIRGYWGSTASAHGAGAGVYTRPPYYRNRLVYFWVHDGTTLRQRARGYLDDIDPNDGHTKITLKVEGPLSRMQGVTRMRYNPALDCVVEAIGEGVDEESPRRVFIDMDDFESVVAKEYDASGSPRSTWYSGGTDLTDLSDFAFAQIDGAIEALYEGVHYFGGAARDLFVGNDFQSSGEGVVDEPVRELAVWQREASVSPYPLTDAESVVTNPYQPAFIAGLLLASGSADAIAPDRLDFVSGNVGLGIDWLLGDEGIQAFIDIANEDRDIDIDQLVLGWNGDPVEILDVVLFKLLLPFGYWLTPTVDGYLIPRRFDPLTVETWAEAIQNQIELLYELESAPRVSQKPGYARILQRYTALLGKTPVDDGTTTEGNAIGASSRLDKMVPPEQSDLDYSVLSVERREAIADIITRQAIFLRANMPRVRIKANDWALESLDYDIGEWSTISVPSGSDPILYDEEGEDVATADLQDASYAMVITGRGWNARTDAYEIDGVLVNYTRKPARYVAPSIEIKSVTTVDGGTKHQLTANVASDSDLALDGDAGEFSEGQPVQLYTSDMTRRETTVLDIDAISGDTITLSGLFTNTPQAGDCLEFCDFDDYDVADFGTERGFCYLADSTDTLGSTNEEADQWQ